MSGVNGREILRIGRKGRKWFALGDPPVSPAKSVAEHAMLDEILAHARSLPPADRQQHLANMEPSPVTDFVRQTIATDPVELDVIRTQTELISISGKYRDDKGHIKEDGFIPWYADIVGYVNGLLGAMDVSDAEALEFQHTIHQEADKLKPFFSSKSPSEPTSSDSSTELIFGE